jgi:hypothetical protein
MGYGTCMVHPCSRTGRVVEALSVDPEEYFIFSFVRCMRTMCCLLQQPGPGRRGIRHEAFSAPAQRADNKFPGAGHAELTLVR